MEEVVCFQPRKTTGFHRDLNVLEILKAFLILIIFYFAAGALNIQSVLDSSRTNGIKRARIKSTQQLLWLPLGWPFRNNIKAGQQPHSG